MNLDFFQQLWSQIFLLNTKQDVKIETVSAPRPSHDNYCEKEDSCKCTGLGFGIWEQFWQRQGFEKATIPRPENCGNIKKPKPIKPPQERFGVWYLSWQVSPFASASIPRPGNNNNNRKAEIRKPQQNNPWPYNPSVWQPFWWINQTEVARIPRSENKDHNRRVENKCRQDRSPWQALVTGPFASASIPRPVNNNNNGKAEIRKPRQNRIWPDKLRVWQPFWRINQNEVASIFRSENKNHNEIVEKKCWRDRFPWQALWGMNEVNKASIHRLENKSNGEKIENSKPPMNKSWRDKLCVWDLFWSINQTEASSIPKSYINKSTGKIENKCQQNRPPWEILWCINQIETTSIPKSYNKKNTEKIENGCQQNRPPWEVLWWINQTETTSIPRPENKSNNRKIEKTKYQKNRSLHDSFGVWEHFWQTNYTERAGIPKPNRTDRKIGNSKPLLDRSPQGRLGVWEIFWQIHRNETAGIPKSEKVSSNKKIENKKPLQDWFGVWKVLWQIKQNETTSISGREKNSNNRKVENNMLRQNMLRMWEHIQQMNLPWNANKGKQAENAKTNEFETVGSGCAIPKFTPYMASIPWHTGPRAFLSQIFPRYGNYCGPNWSSGKDQGHLLWDKEPIDSLDYCCYCHDIGYDTHDQGEMLKADITFLECLEKTWVSNTENSRAAEAYRSMCITGLKTVLIPYRQQLLKQIHAKYILASKISGLDSIKSTIQHH